MEKILIAKSSVCKYKTSIRDWNVTFDNLVKIVCEHKHSYGYKHGSYILRCSKSNDTVAGLLILEGDRRFNMDGGIVSGAPHPEIIDSILSDLNISYIIHTKDGNAMSKDELLERGIDSGGVYGRNYHRYRILIPCKYTEDQLSFLIGYVMHKLHEHGAMLVDEPMNREWLRPWHLPRESDFRQYKMEADVLDIRKAIFELAMTHEEKSPLVAPKTVNDTMQRIEAWIATNTNNQSRLTISDIFTQTLGNDIAYTRKDEMSVAEILTSRGFSKKRVRVDGNLKTIWSQEC